jgi:hypothetical protein
LFLGADVLDGDVAHGGLLVTVMVANVDVHAAFLIGVIIRQRDRRDVVFVDRSRF